MHWTFSSRPLPPGFGLSPCCPLPPGLGLRLFTVLFCLELNVGSNLFSVLILLNMAGMDFVSTATSAQMNPPDVMEHLMAGIALEIGYEQSDVQLKVYVAEQSDARPWTQLHEQDESLELLFTARDEKPAH